MKILDRFDNNEHILFLNFKIPETPEPKPIKERKPKKK